MMTTTMHFGPEWMRVKQPASVRPHAAPSPPTTFLGLSTPSNDTPAPPGVSSYSALVTPPVPPAQSKRDTAHPFRYSREEMLQVWKDGGGCGALPIEVERWEGVVRDTVGEPACLRELSELEKKLYASSLNSELRRRQSTDYMTQGDRSKLYHSGSNHGGPLNNGLGLTGRRRRGDSNGTDQPPLSLPRKSSWSSVTGNLASPSVASPRTRLGGGSGFDGVLNGNDNGWSGGKRRVPSAQPATSRVLEEAENQRDTSAFEIKEEEETSNSKTDEAGRRASPPSSASVLSVDAPHNSADINGLNAAVDNLALEINLTAPQDIGPAVGEANFRFSQPDALELADVQWSYIDRLGMVQGPFSGKTMQQWHDQAYFTDNLMMKRTTIDVDFMLLADIKHRAQGERIFLSPLGDVVPPPGLSRTLPGPGFNSLLHRTGTFDSPRQPSPQAYGRSNTLDSYLNASSTSSASPSSSFGGNFARPPISPDPIAVGSRLANQRFAAEMPLNGRLSTGSYSSNGSPAMPHTIRHVFNDGLQPNRSPSFDAQANMPWQTPQINGIQGWDGTLETSQLGQMGRREPIAASPGGHSPVIREPYIGPVGPISADPFVMPSGLSRGFYEQTEHTDFMGRNMAQRDEQSLQGSFQHQQTSSEPSSGRFTGVPQQLSLPPLSTGFNPDFDQVSSPIAPSPTIGRTQPQLQTRQAPPLSPWGVPHIQESQRPRPFDADRPKSSNTFVTHSVEPQRSAWKKPQVDVQSQANHDSWLANQQGDVMKGWGQLTEEPQSLTTANVNQHNEQQGSLKSKEPMVTESNKPVAVLTANESAPQPPTLKGKGSTTAPVPVPERNQSARTPSVTKATAMSLSSQKSAWAKDDDAKSKQTVVPMGLREIQDAEKKKQEARKAAEKERERAARTIAAATSPGEEVQFTASWGLPTSQAGVRGSAVSTSRDASTPSPSAPVWTNAAKPAAKTMKEIQEEEEYRKLQAVKDKENITSAAKRVVQVPAAKGPLTSQQSGGAWTVVGSGGKSGVLASIVAARPSLVTQPSAPNVTVTASRAAAVISTPRPSNSPQVVKAALAAPKADDDPGAPSPEFLKWMRDSLRGLNSSVQFEEIAQMLLSFPLDPDPSSIELIAETVYGASTTLDGRRFASEFVMKRKADATSRPCGAQGSAGTNRMPTSLADVVKAQPKQTQNEFSGYKVVRKKNKGGRS